MFLLYVFFFKQKTAYELRISDWSSDVCSSDLSAQDSRIHATGRQITIPVGAMCLIFFAWRIVPGNIRIIIRQRHFPGWAVDKIGRASCGKEGGSTCRYRWSPYH